MRLKKYFSLRVSWNHFVDVCRNTAILETVQISSCVLISPGLANGCLAAQQVFFQLIPNWWRWQSPECECLPGICINTLSLPLSCLSYCTIFVILFLVWFVLFWYYCNDLDCSIKLNLKTIWSYQIFCLPCSIKKKKNWGGCCIMTVIIT